MLDRAWTALGALVVALVVATGTSGVARASVGGPAAITLRLSADRPSAAPAPAQRIGRAAVGQRRHAAAVHHRRRAALRRAHAAHRRPSEFARRSHARRLPAAESRLAARASAPRSAGASVTERPAAGCGIEDTAACREPAQAEHALVLETRRAMALGVPAPALRIGFDDWFALERRAELQSGDAVLDAYRIRTAFVEDAIARGGALARGRRAAELGLL